MAKISQLAQVLGPGLDEKIFLNELRWGESDSNTWTMTTPNGTTVASITGGNTINYNGTPSVGYGFLVGNYVKFTNTSNTSDSAYNKSYQITAVGASSFTIASTLAQNAVANGSLILTSINLTGWTFSYKFKQYSATFTKDDITGVVFNNVVAIPTAQVIDLSSNIVRLNDIAGRIALQVPTSAFPALPVIDTDMPPFYLGYLSITQPNTLPLIPIIRKQMIGYIVRSDAILV